MAASIPRKSRPRRGFTEAMTGICTFCGDEKALVKAHIVPKSFYKIDEDPNVIVDVKGEYRPKRSRIGLWDDGILCRSCEDVFSRIDDIAFKALFGKRAKRYVCRGADGTLLVNRAMPVLVYIDSVNPRDLFAFAVSVLWRAFVSKLDQFSDVKLYGLEDLFLAHLKGERDIFDSFHMAIAWETNPDLRGMVMVPGQWDIKDAKILRFVAGGVTFLLGVELSSRFSERFLFDLYNGKQTLLYWTSRNSKLNAQLADAVRVSNDRYGWPSFMRKR